MTTVQSVDLSVWLTGTGAAIALGSAFYARSQAKSAKSSAGSAKRMAEIDAARRHEERAPDWLPLACDAAAGASSLRVQLTLHRGRLDYLVVDICESPGLTFDVNRQVGAVAGRFECRQSMQPGDTVGIWVKAGRGHHRRLRLRVTAGLEDQLWEPILLPELPIVIDGSDEP